MITTIIFSACSILWTIGTNSSHFRCETVIKDDCSLEFHCDTGLVDYLYETRTFKQDIYVFNYQCKEAAKTFLIGSEVAVIARCQK